MNAKQFLNNAVCHTDQGLSGVAAEPHPLPGQTADVRVFARGWDNENVTVRTQFLLLSSTNLLSSFSLCTIFVQKKIKVI